MARRPAELTPLVSSRHLFGAELRYWRQRRGLSLAQLGRAVYVSADLIGKVEKAQRWPSAALVNECEGVLDSGGVLSRLHSFATGERRLSGVPASAEASADPAPSAPVVLIVPVYDVIELSEVLDRVGVPVSATNVVHAQQVDGPAGAVVDLATARARRAHPAHKLVLVARRRRT